MFPKAPRILINLILAVALCLCCYAIFRPLSASTTFDAVNNRVLAQKLRPVPQWTFDSFKTKCLDVNQTFNLLSPRRNHDSVFSEDGNKLYNVAGRGIHNIESMDMRTCEQETVIHSDLLDLNHVTTQMMGSQIVIANGLHGAEVNNETTSEEIVIADLAEKSVKIEANLRIPRGDGGMEILRNFLVRRERLTAPENVVLLSKMPRTWNEDLICIFGGSEGTHDLGVFKADCDCYSRKAKAWLVLPSLPKTLDHLALVRIGDEIVIVGGRETNYAQDSTDLYALKVDEATGTIAENWTLAAQMQRSKSAFIAVPLSNRFVLTTGGITDKLNPGNDWWRETLDIIEVCDLAAPRPAKCVTLKTKLRTPRFAILATVRQWGTDEGAVFACGGTNTGWENLPDCEVFGVRELLADISEVMNVQL